MKQYLVAMDFSRGGEDQIYYLKETSDEVHEIYDPRQATTFKTKAAAKLLASSINFDDYTKVVDRDKAL